MPAFLGRFRPCLVPAILGLLCAVVDVPDERPNTIGVTDDGTDSLTPIVAKRGKPLEAYEEPLPPEALVRIGSTRFRHPWPIHPFTLNRSGRFHVTSDPGSTVTLTDAVTGERTWIQEFGVHRKNGLWGGRDVVPSSDGRRIAIWSTRPHGEPQEVQIWTIEDDPKQLLRRGPQVIHETAFSFINDVVKFSPSGEELIVRNRQMISVFSATSGHCLRSIKFPNDYIRDFSDNGNRVLTATTDAESGFKAFGGGFSYEPTFGFRPPRSSTNDEPMTRRRRIRTSSDESESCRVHVRDMTSEAILCELDLPSEKHGLGPYARLSPDGRYFTSSFQSQLLVWQVEPARQILRIGRPPDLSPNVGYFPRPSYEDDGRTLVLTADDLPTRRFDLATAQERPSIPPPPPKLATTSRLSSCTLSRRLPMPGWPLPLPGGYDGVAMVVDPTGEFLAVGDSTGRLDVWAVDGRHVRTLLKPDTPVMAVAFSNDGRRFACCDATRRVRVFAVKSWTETQTFDVPADHDSLCPDSLAFSPDGRRLLVSFDRIAALYDLVEKSWVWDRAGSIGFSWGSGSRSFMTFTPDGRRLAGQFNVWTDATTGEDYERSRAVSSQWDGLRRAVANHGNWQLRFAPTGSLAAVVESKHIEFRDADGKLVSTAYPSDGESDVGAPGQFSHDGRRFVTHSDDGRAYIWEVASGRLANVVTYPNGAIENVFFGRDGRSLITSSHREVIVWELTADRSSEPWDDLASPDARVAERGRLRLLADPEAIGFIRSHLPPAKKLNDASVRAVGRELDADEYRKRERAAENLRRAGHRATDLLKAHQPTSAEGRERLTTLLAEFDVGPTRYELREIRSVELLEHIRTPAARALLVDLAAGDPDAVLTREAAASLKRLP